MLVDYEDRMDRSMAAATAASDRWLKRKAYLTDYLNANAGQYTELQRRRKFSDDWELNDAMDEWGWHRREALRCATFIDTKVRMAELRDRLRGV